MKKILIALFFVLSFSVTLMADVSYTVDLTKSRIRSTENVDTVKQHSCYHWCYSMWYPTCRMIQNGFIQINFTKSSEVTGIPFLFLTHLGNPKPNVKIIVNGGTLLESTENLSMNPFCLDLTGYLIEGENTIIIESLQPVKYQEANYINRLNITFIESDTPSEEIQQEDLSKSHPQSDEFENYYSRLISMLKGW